MSSSQNVIVTNFPSRSMKLTDAKKILKNNRAQKYLLPYIEPEDESNRKTAMKTTE